MHNYFWHHWMSRNEAWPVSDNICHVLGSPDHIYCDSVHCVVGYDQWLCWLWRTLVETMVLDMGGTEGVDHAKDWYDTGSS